MFDAPEPKTREQFLDETPPEVRAEAEALLLDPGLLDRFGESLEVLGVAGERQLAATLYLIGVSRLLPHPLAAIVQGPSSSGKSYVIDKVASMFPAEAVWQATDMSANALYYMPSDSLRHRLVVAGERSRRHNDDTATATKALREMLSAGRLTKSVVISNGTTGEPETRAISQEGPIAYLESTTAAKIFEEDANRCLLLHTDERSVQTRQILNRDAVKAARNEIGGDRTRLLLVWHTVQRLLEQRPVAVPFAERLAAFFPDNRVEARRAFPQLLGTIGASALLHQRQREQSGEAILASLADYGLARLLLAEPLGRSLGGQLSESILRFHEKLKPLGDQTFTAPQAAKLLGVSEHTVRDSLHVLLDAGAVAIEEPGRGRRPTVWSVRIEVDLPAIAASVLPPEDKLLSELPATAGGGDISGGPF